MNLETEDFVRKVVENTEANLQVRESLAGAGCKIVSFAFKVLIWVSSSGNSSLSLSLFLWCWFFSCLLLKEMLAYKMFVSDLLRIQVLLLFVWFWLTSCCSCRFISRWTSHYDVSVGCSTFYSIWDRPVFWIHSNVSLLGIIANFLASGITFPLICALLRFIWVLYSWLHLTR